MVVSDAVEKEQKPRKKRKSDERALIVKKALMRLIREVANNKDRKKQLAEFTGLSLSAIDALAYNGRGSFSSWINALLFRFEVPADGLADVLKKLEHITRKERSTRPSDTIWFELDQLLTEDDKYYWASIIRYAAELKRTSKK